MPRRPSPPQRRIAIDYQRLPDGSAVLVDLNDGATYAINATAADVWELCDGQRSRSAIVAALGERYAASRATLHAAVAGLLDDWQAQALLEQP